MDQRLQAFLLLVFSQIFVLAVSSDDDDFLGLISFEWENTPPDWKGSDPCSNNWVGIDCTDSRITSITLSSMDLKGGLFGDFEKLSELQALDLSYNKDLTGQLPSTIGKLKNLSNLILVGCSFSGQIPAEIGYLQELVFLSLNSNSFSGVIPPSIGNLSKLYWLDLTDNNIGGTIPVSNGSSPGLDMLLHCKHFHLGKNKLTGPIPNELFNSNMTLRHVLLDSNDLSGNIPSTLGLVQTLEVLRLDDNILSGEVPTNLNSLTKVTELLLSNNMLSGSLPNLIGMDDLRYLDLSNNSYDESDFPPWISTLKSLTTLVMEDTGLRGQISVDLFSLSNLETVIFKKNFLNGSLEMGTSYSTHLRLIDLRTNSITEFKNSEEVKNVNISLAGNPICVETGAPESYCSISISQSNSSYSTARNCNPIACSSDQILSPVCKCAYPYTGTLVFRAPSFSDFGNTNYYLELEKSLITFFQNHTLPVDSVSLTYPAKDLTKYLDIQLQVFPYGRDRFTRIEISYIGFTLSNQTYKPPTQLFGPFYFCADKYENFADSGVEVHIDSKKSNIGIIIGALAVGFALVFLLVLVGVYVFSKKKKVERVTEQSHPFVGWDPKASSGQIPQLKGSRLFTFEELRTYTHNFSATNDLGSGGYGKVYQGTLPNGELVAIKRAHKEATQGGIEFKTEIELLSRVHHKNLVSLLGFCFEQGEQMLIYEYVPNGTLKDALSGKSGIRLDWKRRLRVALGIAKGLSYLHELANPPIIHRDIKSANVLLDDRLIAKVADFGLSKLMGDGEKDHVTTQVKGTMGYMDPEYYMSQQLTEKSDVYSFGVLLLELITGRQPIDQGKYIVREVRMTVDKTKDLYNLHELVDTNIHLGTRLSGFNRFVDLAMRCIEEASGKRPKMSEVVKEIETIMQLAGLNPNADSRSTSASYEKSNKSASAYPFSEEAFHHSASGVLFPSKVELQ